MARLVLRRHFDVRHRRLVVFALRMECDLNMADDLTDDFEALRRYVHPRREDLERLDRIEETVRQLERALKEAWDAYFREASP